MSATIHTANNLRDKYDYFTDFKVKESLVVVIEFANTLTRPNIEPVQLKTFIKI